MYINRWYTAVIIIQYTMKVLCTVENELEYIAEKEYCRAAPQAVIVLVAKVSRKNMTAEILKILMLKIWSPTRVAT